jgi:hypothetical protein
MFRGALSFNQPLGSWDVRNVRTMDDMFRGALSFNQPLGSWDVRSVTSAWSMFEDTPSFNQPLAGWVLFSDADAAAMFRNSAFEHTMAFETTRYEQDVAARHARQWQRVDPREWEREWVRGRRMRPGRVVDAAALRGLLTAEVVPEAWYEEHTETFERALP